MTTFTKLKETNTSEVQLKKTLKRNDTPKTQISQKEKAEIAAFYQKIKPTLVHLPHD